jgi:recombinational DNA repair protein (RecF pathway)
MGRIGELKRLEAGGWIFEGIVELKLLEAGGWIFEIRSCCLCLVV